MNIELEKLVDWSKPKRVNTRNGPRDLRTAPTTEAFWNAWRGGKDILKQAGISCQRNRGNWEALWWIPIGKQEAAAVNATVAESKATALPVDVALDSTVNIPAPAGLEYLPFQRAGIHFILKAWGEKCP